RRRCCPIIISRDSFSVRQHSIEQSLWAVSFESPESSRWHAMAWYTYRRMAQLSFDIDEVIAGRLRLSEAQALELYENASIHELSEWACAVAQRLHPEDYRTYVIDRNINYTNV